MIASPHSPRAVAAPWAAFVTELVDLGKYWVVLYDTGTTIMRGLLTSQTGCGAAFRTVNLVRVWCWHS
jgi:hypothetical protein